MFRDNQAVIAMSQNSSYLERAKHIEPRSLAIQDIVNHGDIVPRFCASDKNVADLLTKEWLLRANEIGTTRPQMALIL